MRGQLLSTAHEALRKQSGAYRNVVWDYDNTLAAKPPEAYENPEEYHDDPSNLLQQEPLPTLERFKDQLARDNVAAIVTGRGANDEPYIRQWLVENGVPEEHVEGLEIRTRDYESQAEFPGIDAVTRSKVEDIQELAPDLVVDDHVERLRNQGLNMKDEQLVHPEQGFEHQSTQTPSKTEPVTQGRNQGAKEHIAPQEHPEDLSMQEAAAPDENTDAMQGAGARPDDSFSAGGESAFDDTEDDPEDPFSKVASVLEKRDPHSASPETHVQQGREEGYPECCIEQFAHEDVHSGKERGVFMTEGSDQAYDEFAYVPCDDCVEEGPPEGMVHQEPKQGIMDRIAGFFKATSHGRLSAQQQRTDSHSKGDTSSQEGGHTIGIKDDASWETDKPKSEDSASVAKMSGDGTQKADTRMGELMDQHGDDMADDFSQDMADNWDQAEQMEQEATPGMNKVFAQGKFAKQEDEGGGEPEFPALDEEPIEEEPMDEDPLGDEMDADPALDEGGGDGGGDVASDLDAVQDAQDAVEDVAEATGSGSLDELEQDLMDVQELAGSLRAAADAAERAQLSDKEKRQMQKRERRTSMYPLASSNDAEAAIFGEDPGPLERETAPTRTRSRNRV